jgi:hypothetical protein
LKTEWVENKDEAIKVIDKEIQDLNYNLYLLKRKRENIILFNDFCDSTSPVSYA